MRRTRINKFLAATAVGVVVCGVASRAAAVTAAEVRQAIAAGVAQIKQAQKPNGSWKESAPGGETALCTLALLNAGVPADDPAVASALQYLRKVPNQRTYVVSLKAQVFAACGLKEYRKDLRAAAQWLVRTQHASGTWNYTGRGGGDNSNTQFALLGLHEAAKAGVPVPAQIWQRSSRHFEKTQTRDGGWGYSGRGGPKGSMTTAGLASLYICGHRLNVAGNKVFENGAYPDCGKYKQNKALAAGIGWLTTNFSVTTNPKGNNVWHYYYLYGLERVGMISGLRNFGRHDWYRRGADRCVRDLRAGRRRQLWDTAFAVLFLAKGNRPVLFQKLKWDGRWNRNIHDLENLCGFIDDKLGKPVTWQTATLDLPLKELRVSPILLITGHKFPAFTDAEKVKLQRFVRSGGTLLFEACCGAKAFDAGFAKFVAAVFPEYRLRTLKEDHPVFRSYYRLAGKDRNDLKGIDVGCRTGVFYSRKALSCLWELQTIPVHSERAMKIGTNIAAYATGREPLADKLDEVALAGGPKAAGQFEVPRGAVRLARLIHKGDYNADARAMVNLAAKLRDQAKIDVVAKARHLRADDEKLFEYPVLFMTGHYAFKLSQGEINGLRTYLQRGGVLVADACCGKEDFDKSFREMMAAVLPDQPLTPLEKDHPIYTGEIGVDLGEIRYRKLLADELKQRGTTHPPLDVARIKGRVAVIYSQYDWSCALEGDRPFSSRGYQDEGGAKLAVNIFLYAISY